MKTPCLKVLISVFFATMAPCGLMAQTRPAPFDGSYTGILSGSGKSCVGGEKKVKIEGSHFTWSYGSSGQRYNDDIAVRPDGSFERDLSSGVVKGQVHSGQISMTLQVSQCFFKYEAKKAG